ncbi:hypothetical protein EN817_31910, partial [Mesorhizobium sp. M3A.F.Ca.ET.174.01.1.1]
ALVEEAAAAASSLEDQADKLRQAVAVFQLGDDAGKASASAAAKHVPLRAASAVARPASRVAGHAGSAAPAAAAVAAQPVSAGHAPAAAASPAPVAAAAAAKSNPVPRATAKPAA